MTGAVILDVVYGLDVPPGDSTIEAIETALHALMEMMLDVWIGALVLPAHEAIS